MSQGPKAVCLCHVTVRTRGKKCRVCRAAEQAQKSHGHRSGARQLKPSRPINAKRMGKEI